VVVITRTREDETQPDFPFEIARRPSARDLMRLTAWAHVVFHNNISLRAAWPLLVVRRPWVVAHQTWLPRVPGLPGMKAVFKRKVLRGATGIAISQAIATDFTTPCTVIPNPYDDEIFRPITGIERDRDLAFVGRFVSAKGLPVLLGAMGHLAERGLRPALSVIGSGPEEQAWRRLADQMGLSDQVEFVGVKRERELAELLNAHRVMVVPSLWNEPFGVVALEGMACGCVVVGSEGGGLKEAIGPAGLTFANGDAEALAAAIDRALNESGAAGGCRAAAKAHLARHAPPVVARHYLDVLERVLAR
jgi:glycosyltransferase involved in cell wall biosynthesis